MAFETMTRGSQFFNSPWWNSFFKIAHFGLRILANGLAMVSIVTILTSNQEIYMPDNDTYIAVAKAHYSYSSALRYKLIVDVVLGVYSLLSTIMVYKTMKFSHSDATSSQYFYLLIGDAVMMVLTISGCTATTAVGLVALSGIEKPGISWTPICPLAGKFCRMIIFSVASSYAAFACMTALTFISAFKLKILAEH